MNRKIRSLSLTLAALLTLTWAGAQEPSPRIVAAASGPEGRLRAAILGPDGRPLLGRRCVATCNDATLALEDLGAGLHGCWLPASWRDFVVISDASSNGAEALTLSLGSRAAETTVITPAPPADRDGRVELRLSGMDGAPVPLPTRDALPTGCAPDPDGGWRMSWRVRAAADPRPGSLELAWLLPEGARQVQVLPRAGALSRLPLELPGLPPHEGELWLGETSLPLRIEVGGVVLNGEGRPFILPPPAPGAALSLDLRSSDGISTHLELDPQRDLGLRRPDEPRLEVRPAAPARGALLPLRVTLECDEGSVNAQGGTRPPSTPRSEFAESQTPAVALLAQGSLLDPRLLPVPGLEIIGPWRSGARRLEWLLCGDPLAAGWDGIVTVETSGPPAQRFRQQVDRSRLGAPRIELAEPERLTWPLPDGQADIVLAARGPAGPAEGLEIHVAIAGGAAQRAEDEGQGRYRLRWRPAQPPSASPVELRVDLGVADAPGEAADLWLAITAGADGPFLEARVVDERGLAVGGAEVRARFKGRPAAHGVTDTQGEIRWPLRAAAPELTLVTVEAGSTHRQAILPLGFPADVILDWAARGLPDGIWPVSMMGSQAGGEAGAEGQRLVLRLALPVDGLGPTPTVPGPAIVPTPPPPPGPEPEPEPEPEDQPLPGAGVPEQLELVAATPALPGDGRAQTRVDARVLDIHDQPVAGVVVDLARLSGTGSVDPLFAITDRQGVARFAYTAGTVTGAVTLRGALRTRPFVSADVLLALTQGVEDGRLRIVSVAAIPTSVTRGQTGCALTVRLANEGGQVVGLTGVSLRFGGATAGYQAVAAAGNAASIAAGQTVDLSFTVAVENTAALGATALDAVATAVDLTTQAALRDDGADATDQWTVLTPAALTMTVSAVPAVVTRGETGVVVTLTLTNGGQTAANVSAATLRFTAAADFAATRTDAIAQVTGGAAAALSFRFDVAAAAALATSVIDASLSATDANTAQDVGRAAADTTDSVTVQAFSTPAKLRFKAGSGPPASERSHAVWAPLAVEVLDAFGNLVTTATNALRLRPTPTNAGNPAVFAGTTSVNAVSGEARFFHIAYQKALGGDEAIAVTAEFAADPALGPAAGGGVTIDGGRYLEITRAGNFTAGVADPVTVEVRVLGAIDATFNNAAAAVTLSSPNATSSPNGTAPTHQRAETLDFSITPGSRQTTVTFTFTNAAEKPTLRAEIAALGLKGASQPFTVNPGADVALQLSLSSPRSLGGGVFRFDVGLHQARSVDGLGNPTVPVNLIVNPQIGASVGAVGGLQGAGANEVAVGDLTAGGGRADISAMTYTGPSQTVTFTISDPLAGLAPGTAVVVVGAAAQAAPADGEPLGTIVLLPAAASLPADGQSLVRVRSEPIRDHRALVVPDGTLIGLRALLGTIATPDADPASEGLQLATAGGRIEFTVGATRAAGTELLLAFTRLAAGQTTLRYLGPGLPPHLVQAEPSGSRALATLTIALLFDQPMHQVGLAAALTLCDQGGATLPRDLRLEDGQRRAVITPVTPLPAGGRYRIIIDATAPSLGGATLDGDLDGLGSGLASDAVEVEWGALADALPPRLTGLRVEPPRITPDGDGRADRAEITADFADDRAGGRVRLEVLGPGGPLAYRLAPRAGDSAHLSFDGRDDRGRLLSEGLYRLRLVPIDAAGNEGLGMQGELEIAYPIRIWEVGP